MGDDVIEGRQIEAEGACEIDGVKSRVVDLRIGREPSRVVDVRRDRVDAVKYAERVSCRQNCGGHSLAATEIAPSEPSVPGGWLDPANERYMVKPGGRQHRLEIAQIRDVADIAAEIARHRLPPAVGEPGATGSSSPIAKRNAILPANRSFPGARP